MSSEILSPVTSPSLLYPELFGVKPFRKHYKCPRCSGNMRTRLQAKIVRKNEIVFGFACDNCHKRWYFSSKLILNEILEEQIQRIARFTKETQREFGAVVVKTPEGIRLDMIEIGEAHSVTFKKTHELRSDEKIVGSWHSHQATNEFSDWDVGTFLSGDWEKISIVSGADDSIGVMVKTVDTIMIGDVEGFVKDYRELNLIDKADAFKFLLFRGKVNNLRLLAGVSKTPVTSLERLLREQE